MAFSGVTEIRSWANARLLAAAREFGSSQGEVVIVGATRAAADELAFDTAAAGFHRFTLLQLAADLARPAMANLDLAPLSGLGIEALAARVAYAAREHGELAYFGEVARLPGFARALARTLGELRLTGVSPDALAGGGAAGADLACLLRRYLDELDTRGLADLARTFDLANEALESGATRWSGLPLILLDPPLPSAAHQEFAERLAASSPAALRVSLGESDAAEPPNALANLRSFVFSDAAPTPASDEQFEIFSAPGEGLEAIEIARRIQALAKNGVAFDQIAILLRTPERYQPMIDDALRRAAIPAWFSRGTARPDPGGRAFLALLACACEQLSASRFAEYLSLGQVPLAPLDRDWTPPADELLRAGESTAETEDDAPAVAPAPARWEQLLVDAAVIGGRDRWVRRLRGLEREFEMRIASLERHDEPYKHLEQRLEQLRHLEQFALPIIDALDRLPHAARWGEWIKWLGDLARLALRKSDGVLEALAEFEPMSDVGPATREEVSEVLSDRLRFLRREPPPRRWGCVFVASIEEARGREFSVVFLPGLAEGLFPQRMLEDPLLLDEFRRAVSSALPLRDDRTQEERLRLRIAIAAARDRLIASFPRMDVGEARPRVPSFYALELPRAIEGRLPELKQFEQRARDAAPARLNWPAPADPAIAIDDAEYDLAVLKQESPSARHLMELNPALARSLRGRWYRWRGKWSEADGLVTGNAQALAALALHRFSERPWSPSSLQHFAVCPYRFALHGIFQLAPREEAIALEQLDPRTRGELFHAVQFRLLNELRDASLLPVNTARLGDALARADRVLEQVAAEYEEQLAPAVKRVWSSEIDDLRIDLRGWLQHIATQDDDWKPEHFEYAFGLTMREGRDPASVAEPVALPEIGVTLRGSIDLVEFSSVKNLWRVTDHKTGRPPESPPLYVGGGKLLQPMLYALAAEKLIGKPVETGRLFYSTQRGGYSFTPVNATAAGRAFMKRLVENVDSAIAQGFLPPVPQKDACEFCDYRPVCGPYEQRRLLKKNTRDERIDPLNEIRSMP
jgi:CRISPR/Cas system-associated exonuclease Cas4 (RecB family)